MTVDSPEAEAPIQKLNASPSAAGAEKVWPTPNLTSIVSMMASWLLGSWRRRRLILPPTPASSAMSKS